MYTFRNGERWEKCRAAIRELILHEGFLEQLAGSREEYLWAEHCKNLLTGGGGEEFAQNQIRQVVVCYLKGEFRDPSATEIHHVTSAILGLHGATCWPVVGAALVGEENFLIEDLLKPKHVFGQFVSGQEQPEAFSCVLWSVPTDFLIGWCGQNLKAVERLFGVAGLFVTQQDGSFSWHPTITALLEHFYRAENSGEIAGNLLSFSSCGSRVPYIQRRIDLLKQLRRSPSPAVRGLGDELIPLFEQQKEAEQKQDAQFRAGIF
jgi:hypothetical protein